MTGIAGQSVANYAIALGLIALIGILALAIFGGQTSQILYKVSGPV